MIGEYLIGALYRLWGWMKKVDRLIAEKSGEVARLCPSFINPPETISRHRTNQFSHSPPREEPYERAVSTISRCCFFLRGKTCVLAQESRHRARFALGSADGRDRFVLWFLSAELKSRIRRALRGCGKDFFFGGGLCRLYLMSLLPDIFGATKGNVYA